MNKPFKQDWRYAQANREALLTLGAYGLYFVWWYACAYGLERFIHDVSVG